MISLFVDTSGWASVFDSRQAEHQRAIALFKQFHQQQVRIVTTNYVLAELVALLDSPLKISRPQIFQIIDTIKTTSYLEAIHIDADIDRAAWELCKSRPDKAWSLVDCSSFVVMQQLNIQQALTGDRHFEQAGFIRLLK